MAKEVDQRIVEMRFENEQFQRNIKQTIKSLDNLSDKLAMDTASRGFDDLQRLVDKFNWGSFSQGLDMVMDKVNSWSVLIERKVKTAIIDKVANWSESLVKSMTAIGQAGSGYSKYTEKMESVMTIMNATGLSMEKVNEYLEQLMLYSDETSFSFTEMTKALATFTSSGAKIDDVVPMIEGIANATAHAGKGGQALNSALLNLSQSFGSGYLQSIDWKSVVGQGIGSKSLKEAFIEAAKALGTLNKEGKTAKGTLVTVGNFNDTLKEKWVNTDVMTATFKNYAAMFTEAEELVKNGKAATITKALEMLDDKYDGIAKDSFNAAQNTKSFREAIDATKDAVSSGWLRTFEIIFGNFEEAREMWTDLTDRLWEAFASGEKDRNEFFTQWRAWDGRLNMIRAFQNAWDAVMNVLELVKDGIDDIFPDRTGKRLAKFTKSLADLTEQFKLFDWYVNAAGEDEKVFTPLGLKVKAVFDGISSVLGTVVDFFKEFGRQAGRVAVSLKPLATNLFNFIVGIGKRLGVLRKDLGDSNAFANILTPIADTIIAFVKMITPVVSGGLDGLLLFADDIQLALKKLSDLLFFDSIHAVGKSGLDMFVNLFKSFGEAILSVFDYIRSKGIIGILADGKEMLDEVGSSIGGILDWAKEKIPKFFEGIVKFVQSPLGAGLATIIAVIAIMKLMTRETHSIFGIFGKIKRFFRNIDRGLEDVRRYVRRVNIRGIILALTGVITGILLIATSIKTIADTFTNNTKGFAAAIASITGIFIMLAGLFIVVKTTSVGGGKELANFGKFAQGIGIAINFIATAIIQVANFEDEEKLRKATKKISGILVLLMGFALGASLFLSNKLVDKVLKELGRMFLRIGVSILIMSKSIRSLGMMDSDVFQQGILGLAAIAGIISVMGGIMTALSDWGDSEGFKGLGVMFRNIALSILGIILSAKWLGKALGDEDKRGEAIAGLIGVGAIFAAFAVVIAGLSKWVGNSGQYMDKISKFIGKLSGMMIAFTVAIGGMALIASFDTASLWNAVGVVSVLELVTALFVGIIAKLASKKGNINMKGVGRTLLALAASMAIISVAIAALTGVASIAGADNFSVVMGMVTMLIVSILGMVAMIAGFSKKMKPDALRNRFKGITSMFLSLSLLMFALSIVINAFNVAYAVSPGSTALAIVSVLAIIKSIFVGISGILVMLTSGKITFYQLEELSKTIKAIGGVITVLSIVAVAFSVFGGDTVKFLAAAGMMTIMMGAIALIIYAMSKLSTEQTADAGKITALILAIGAVIAILSGIAMLVGDVGKFAATMLIMSVAIAALTFAIRGLMKAAQGSMAGGAVIIGILLSVVGIVGAVALAIKALSQVIDSFRLLIRFMNNETEWKGIKAFFSMLRDEIPATLVTIMMSVALGFSSMMASILTTVAKSSVKMRGLWYTGIMMAIGGIIDALYDGSAIIGKYIPGIAGNLGQGFMQAFVDSIRTKFGWVLKLIGLDDEFEELAGNVMAGFDKGLKNSQDEVSEAVRNYLAKNAVDTAETELDIRSPSRVFAAIGNFVSLGMAKGIKDGSPEAVKATEDAVGAITGAAEGKLKNIDFDGIENAMSSVVNQVNSANPTLAFNYAGALQQAEYERMLSLQGLQQLAADTALSVKDAIAINVHHSFDTLRIEGVNDRKTLVETIEVSVEEILGKIVRKQGRM